MERDRQLTPLPMVLLKRKGVEVADLCSGLGGGGGRSRSHTGGAVMADLLFYTGVGVGYDKSLFNTLC